MASYTPGRVAFHDLYNKSNHKGHKKQETRNRTNLSDKLGKVVQFDLERGILCVAAKGCERK